MLEVHEDLELLHIRVIILLLDHLLNYKYNV